MKQREFGIAIALIKNTSQKRQADMNRSKGNALNNASHYNEPPTPCIKMLFETEQSHYSKKIEDALPTEDEIKHLMEFITKNTDKAEWPDDTSFYNEVLDRLNYNFREELIHWLDTSNTTRQDFINLNGEKLAKTTFDSVKSEYHTSNNARSYWGEKVGYFS